MKSTGCIILSKTSLALYKKKAKQHKTTMKGLVEYLAENLDSLPIKWDEVKIDHPSPLDRWKRVKEAVTEVSKITKNRKELLSRCAARGLSEKQVDAALKILGKK